MEKPILTNGAREARAKYMREYRKRNRIKDMNARARYWEKKALEESREKKEDKK